MISAKLTIHLSEATTQSFPVFSLIYDASKDIHVRLLFVGLIKAMNVIGFKNDDWGHGKYYVFHVYKYEVDYCSKYISFYLVNIA